MRVQETLVVPLATGGSWDSSNGRDGEPMINRGSRKSIAVSQHLQLGVAKTIHLSGKAATPALGRDLPIPRPIASDRFQHAPAAGGLRRRGRLGTVLVRDPPRGRSAAIADSQFWASQR